MALSQTIWSLNQKMPLEKSQLLSEKELEDLLCEHIEILNPEWMVIGRQVKTSAGKFLDILCMEYGGDLIVVELKKKLTPREVTAQVIDYASCVDKMTWEEVSNIYFYYSNEKGSLAKAYSEKYGEELDEVSVDPNVKMVIVAAEMDASTERIITYLHDKYLVDINVLFFQVFQDGNQRYISRAWLQNENEEKANRNVQAKGEWNGEFCACFGREKRKWSDALKYGFISAGGGIRYSNALKQLSIGDRVWVNIPHTGYVGVGIVTEEAKIVKDVQFFVDGVMKNFQELQTDGEYLQFSDDADIAEYIVKIDWIKTVPEEKAVKEVGFFGNQNVVCRPKDTKWDFTVNRLKEVWNIDD